MQDTTINEWHTSLASGRINASNLMHLEQRVQPRVAEPHEVPRRGTAPRREVVPQGGRDRPDGAGDRRRPGRLPDREDRDQRAGVPAARARLCEPRRAGLHGPRPGVRLGRGTGVGRRDHGAHDRPGLPDERPDRRGAGAVRGLRPELGRDAPRDAQAPGRSRRDRRRARARGAALGRQAVAGRRSRSAPSTGTATRRRRCSRPPGRSA